jgi:hypothetical protein
MIARLRDALLWLLGRRQPKVQRVTCLHSHWSGCKFGYRWCLNCGLTVRC